MNARIETARTPSRPVTPTEPVVRPERTLPVTSPLPPFRLASANPFSSVLSTPAPGSPRVATPGPEAVKPSLLMAFPRALSAELHAGTGLASWDARLGLDVGALRNAVTPFMASKDHSGWTVARDLLISQSYDIVLGLGEHVALKLMGKDTTWKGAERFYRDVKEHGLFGLRFEGMEWKDGNFGSTIDTLHGFPFALASSFMTARGYHPLVSLATGVFTNVVMHEIFFERWEQPKSSYDMLFMNMLGAIFGAFPSLGMEMSYGLVSGQPQATFYGKDNNGHRYSVSFEQHEDYFANHVPREQIPVLPWNVALGMQVKAEDGLSVGLELRLVTDRNEMTNPLKAIDHVEFGASLRYQLP